MEVVTINFIFNYTKNMNFKCSPSIVWGESSPAAKKDLVVVKEAAKGCCLRVLQRILHHSRAALQKIR